ncbi:hypothetical protein BDZ91DRAFT_730038 [Kalaharituber pfeilii]|nr:hypothetical protein BDZ91DRAFT_730038 [Kalaharituber pfeilii]
MDSKIDTDYTPGTSAYSTEIHTPVPSNTGGDDQEQTSTAGSQIQLPFDSGVTAQFDAIQQALATVASCSNHLQQANIALVEKLVMALKATKPNTIQDISNSGVQSEGKHTDHSMPACLAIGDLTEDGVFKSSDHSSLNSSHPPAIMVGLNKLDCSKNEGVHVKAYATGITENLFQMHVETWNDSVMYCTGCTWLALHPKASEMGFQTGTFSTTEDHPREPPIQITNHWITFEHPYDAIPSVVLWLNSLDTSKHTGRRIYVIASDVSKSGFRLHIHSWGPTKLYSAGVSWLAYPAEFPGIESGNFVGRWGDVRFRKFSKPPRRVMVALNMFHSDWGMGWRVDTWGDSILYQCGGAYIALE